MNPNDVSSVIDALVEKLGPYGSAIWKIVLEQTIYVARLSITWGWILLAVAIVMIVFLILYNKISYSDTFGVNLTFVCGSVFLLTLAAFLLSSGYITLTNPTYYAIKALFGH